ncbi:GumC family protein [Methylobacterium gnaphalii]|uniref:Protein-tyrosine kinase n=1 Tax=Methylobacterium gnaphalii TaxID=1010610 RepID=A0A512JNS4_9HYPH|nr:polysaccharide biosynthesis tyrosine autokinase [Methylobacterium gnaphalii]GEP11606.1 protein-tyrosine kinase [Methylobacterium gnaphalii]GJD69591.1 hypothetical protein MMMDOFMJ_2528 [Methylobacterium gnaphalii]GLS49131.1 protein-tyrosine kinase [Methylobacterium gnaphalii]
MNRTVEQPSRSVSFLLRQTSEGQTLGIVAAARRRWRLIAILAAAALVISTAVSLQLPNKYAAEALIQVELGRPGAQQAAQAVTATLEGSAIVESEARVLRSNFIAQRVVKDLGLEEDPDFAPRPSLLSRLLLRKDRTDPEKVTERIAKELSRNLSVTNDSRAYLISVTYTSSDPERSARIANAFVDAYLRNRLDMGVASAERTSAWLQEQIRSTRAALDQADTAVEQFRQKTGYIEGTVNAPNLAQQELRDATTRLGTAIQNRLAAEARLARAREAFAAGSVPSAQDLAGAPVVQRMLEAVETAKRDFQNVAQMGPRHPNYLNAKANLEGVEERLRKEVEQAIGNLEADLRTALGDETVLSGQVDKFKKGVIEAMGRETQLTSLQASASAIRERLKLLNDGYAQAAALAGMKSSTSQALVRAQPNTIPSGPNRAFIIGLSILGASGAGLCAAVLLERRNTGFRSATDLVQDAAVRCLGMVPKIDGSSTAGEMRMFDEAVRLISASLGWSRSSLAPQTLLVSSAVPREGKSLLCTALAKSLTGRGHRVLVIDCNSDEDDQQDDRVSLSDAVLGDQRLVLDRLGNSDLTVLRGSSGGNLRDLYATTAFSNFMDLARESFDLVLIEAPPVLLFQEAITLAHHADATILAVRWKQTPRDTVLAALQRLQDQTVRVRGIILTQVDLDDHRHDRVVDQCYHYSQYRALYERRARTAQTAGSAPMQIDLKAS